MLCLSTWKLIQSFSEVLHYSFAREKSVNLIPQRLQEWFRYYSLSKKMHWYSNFENIHPSLKWAHWRYSALSKLVWYISQTWFLLKLWWKWKKIIFKNSHFFLEIKLIKLQLVNFPLIMALHNENLIQERFIYLKRKPRIAVN